MDKKSRIEELVEILNRASEAYYSDRDEIMSNYEWDKAFDELSELEESTGYIMDNSPTHNVSSSDKIEINRVQHEFPALSLAKTKNISDLMEWAGDRDVNLSYKLDGLTLVLTYDDKKLVRILTRGDGIYGNDITILKSAINGIPLEIDYDGHLVVRGEAVISYSDFNKINALMEDDEKYANPRNLAAGTMALDDPSKVKERRVSFNAFTLVYIDNDINSWSERMGYLKKLGFNTVEYVSCKADKIEKQIDYLTSKVENGTMDIPVDGLVLCYDDNSYSQSGSVTGHHALRAGYAFKWADVSEFSILKEIEWSCAASTISPVAIFEPVKLEGTTVSRASLCNISEMERLGIGKNCTVEVIKANKIIPKIVSVKDSSGCFVIPDVCPVCGAPTTINVSPNSGTKTLKCNNPDCTAKKGRKFERFVSKQAMDIDGLSIQTMVKFINVGFLKQYADIFHLNRYSGDIISFEGFGEKSLKNMLAAIEKSRNVKAVNLIYALSIPMIGLDAAKKIINNLGFDVFVDYLTKNLSFDDIDGIGPEKSKSILEWYSNDKNRTELELLLKEITVTDGDAKKIESGSCMGLTFVITGDVNQFKNRDEFKQYVESNGGKVAGSVSKKTNFLVNNDFESGSSKNRKANELGIPIISETEFIEKFGKDM